jgi:RsiW-degrading membrane proteinase PrsW (M82 family)
MAESLNPTVLAIILGLSPSLIWLIFWRHLVKRGREPMGLVLLCFLLGAASVFLATFFQGIARDLVADPSTRIAVWAGIEEVLKFGVFMLVAHKSAYNDDALDPAMYLIAVALGFAALENIFYIMKPAESFNITASLLTGGLRFFGSTLLHAIASCFIGIVITLAPKMMKGIGMIVGIAGAIFLHSTFNFFILKDDTASFIQIYGYLWIVAIISHVILEKFRRIPPTETLTHAI